MEKSLICQLYNGEDSGETWVFAERTAEDIRQEKERAQQFYATLSNEQRELYMEMRQVNENIDNGISEVDALFAFAARCVTPDIKKFTSFVVQGLEKGNKDLADALRHQTDELWALKKQNTLRRGELASSKLMIPLMIMFVGVLIMVMGPIMTNLGL